MVEEHGSHGRRHQVAQRAIENDSKARGSWESIVIASGQAIGGMWLVLFVSGCLFHDAADNENLRLVNDLNSG